MQTLKKTGSRMPLRMKKAALVRSNYIPRMFNPCGDVTVSYLLWPEVDMSTVLESEHGQKWRYGALKACVG